MKIISEPIPYAEYIKRLETINKATGESLNVTAEAYNAYIEQIQKNQILLIEAQQSYEEAKRIQEHLTRKFKHYGMISTRFSPKHRKVLSRIQVATKR